jgi:hypothetical protein
LDVGVLPAWLLLVEEVCTSAWLLSENKFMFHTSRNFIISSLDCNLAHLSPSRGGHGAVPSGKLKCRQCRKRGKIMERGEKIRLKG